VRGKASARAYRCVAIELWHRAGTGLKLHEVAALVDAEAEWTQKQIFTTGDGKRWSKKERGNMNAVDEKAEVFTNPGGYYEIEADKFRPMGQCILVRWEAAHDSFRAGKINLARPETYKGAHYTGTVLKVGNGVGEDVQPGMRIFFEQFSGFEKMFDPKYGRLALVREPSVLCILPSRVKVESMDGDYDFNS
jgi:hypothetical protein